MNIQNALIQLRNELNINQTELAILLNVSNVTVNRWEKGKSTPNRAMSMAILAIAKTRGASKICIATLQEALFPTAKEEGLDDLKYAEINQINQLLNNSSNGVIVFDMESNEILYMNQQMAVITDQTMEEAKTKKCYEFLRGKNKPCDKCRCHSANLEQYTSYEYLSPRTGRSYIVRSKLLTWKNRPAYILYITDDTELNQVKSALEERERVLLEASRFADLYVIKYDVKKNWIYMGKRLREEFGLPEEIHEFPKNLSKDSMICEDTRVEFQKLFLEVRQGKKQIEADIRANLGERGIHWLRLRMNTIQFDEEGNPEIAICSAQVIDIEKMLENHKYVEKEKQIKGTRLDSNLLGYVVSNLNRNCLIEHKNYEGKAPDIELNMTYEQAIHASGQSVISEKDRERFITMHDRKRLMQICREGKFSDSIETQHSMKDGKILWLRNELSLLVDPETGDIFLNEYCYDIHKEKLYKTMMEAVVQHNFDFYAIIYLNTNHVVLIDTTRDDKNFVESDYDEALEKYCRHEVPESDWEAYCRMVSLDHIKQQLDKTGIFGFNYKMITKSGEIRMKHCKYSYYDKEAGICLAARFDMGYPVLEFC